MYKKYFKRLLDIIISLCAIIVLIPVYIIVSILVLIFMGWPIVFKQPRPGKNQKIFNMYKFRTMTNKTDEHGALLPDSERLTKFGKILRSTSIDELPELFAILFGEMSIIGPRPLLIEYLPYYTEKELHRHDVRPGLTGLAQVSGRNLLEWEKRFDLDLKYVNTCSLFLDIKIILLTIKKVIFREDIVVGNDHILKRLDDERKLYRNYYRITIRTLKKHYSEIKNLMLQMDSVSDSNIVDIMNNMEKYLCDGSAIINVYEDKKSNNLIGLIWCYKINYKKFHINYFIVDKENRKNGIGSTLLKNTLNEANIYELNVRKSNKSAIDFYIKNGFKIIKTDDTKHKMMWGK